MDIKEMKISDIEDFLIENIRNEKIEIKELSGRQLFEILDKSDKNPVIYVYYENNHYRSLWIPVFNYSLQKCGNFWGVATGSTGGHSMTYLMFGIRKEK
jgi:hypothetical protein